jgi:hypothetical protein
MWGQVLHAGATTEGMEVTLHPYEATVIVLSDQSVKHVPADARRERRLPLSGAWRVAFGGQPAEPVDLPHIWEDQPGRQHYSGAVTYTTSIDLGAVDGQVLIDFGECEVSDGGAVEHDLVGPSYRVAVRARCARSPRSA